MNALIKYLTIVAASAALICSCKAQEPVLTFPKDPNEPEEPAGKKPCFIWIDASANFPDFANSKENIARDLKLAAETGFTDIVVDIRPTTGDVLFKTDKCAQVDYLGAWTSAGYEKFERTAEWDYLQCFIDEGHKLGLRVYAGFNTFVGGNVSPLGPQGVVFRDDKMKSLATVLNTEQGLRSIMDCDNSAKFFNPVNPEVQDYICSLLKDLASYKDLDGIILDRGRFDCFMSDFSDYTKKQFEAYVGKTIDPWPASILPPGHNSGLPSEQPEYMKKWMEFRVKVIHDFMVKARETVKSVNDKINFGVYVGGWYASYYDVGVNWASPKYNTSSQFSWATPDYKKFGYADHMDVMLIGAYASPGSVYGQSEWSMQGFCKQAVLKTLGDPGLLVGGPDVGNWDYQDKFTQEQENDAITKSVKACADECGGYFLFDMIHLKKADQWKYAKAGIDQLNPPAEK